MLSPTKPDDQRNLILKDGEICIYNALWNTQKEMCNISTHKSMHILTFTVVKISLLSISFAWEVNLFFICFIFKNNYKLDTIFFILSIFDCLYSCLPLHLLVIIDIIIITILQMRKLKVRNNKLTFPGSYGC